MEYMRSTILEKIISDNLWLKILLAITHVWNLLFTFLLDRLHSYKLSITLFLKLCNIIIPKFIIYVFIYKKKKKAKFAKLEL